MVGVLSETGTAYPSRAPEVTLRSFRGVCVALHFSFLLGCFFYYVSLRSEFRCGSSLTSVVCGRISYLRCLCLFVYSGIQLILCCVFALFYFVWSGIPYVASFSGLSFFECPFDIL